MTGPTAPAPGQSPGRGGRGIFRQAPDRAPGPAGRLCTATPAAHGRPAAAGPTCFVYGPTDFVEAVADILVDPGHDPRRVCTERPGPGARRAAEPDR